MDNSLYRYINIFKEYKIIGKEVDTLRICNHCGRMYDEHLGGCSCRTKEKRTYKHENFYDSPRWKALARMIKVRDFCTDRLALYLSRSESPQDASEDARTYKLLRDYLIDVYGNSRRLSERLICHHIIPREDDYSLQYNVDNLISVSNDSHEYIHQLYSQGKQEQVQCILRHAVQATLP